MSCITNKHKFSVAGGFSGDLPWSGRSPVPGLFQGMLVRNKSSWPAGSGDLSTRRIWSIAFLWSPIENIPTKTNLFTFAFQLPLRLKKQGRFDGTQISFRCFTPGSYQDEFGLCLSKQQHRFFWKEAALCPLQPHQQETRTCSGSSIQQLFDLRVVFTTCRIFQVLRYPSLSWHLCLISWLLFIK